MGVQGPAWRDFEQDISDLATHLGYGSATTPPSGDAGVDVIARRADRVVAIQCKLYGTTRVGSEAIQKLLASKVIHGATDFICITSGSFTGDAVKLATQTGVLAIDGSKLRELCVAEKFVLRAASYLTDGKSFWPLRLDCLRLGRLPDSEILLDRMSVSRTHARLIRQGLHVYLEDLGSTYGTRLNGVAISTGSRQRISYGDTIAVADIKLGITFESDIAPMGLSPEPISAPTSSHSAPIPADIFGRISRKAASEYTNDYEMQRYVIEQQMEAYQTVLKLKAPIGVPEAVFQGIKAKAIGEYPEDYEMQLYVTNQEVEAYAALRDLHRRHGN